MAIDFFSYYTKQVVKKTVAVILIAFFVLSSPFSVYGQEVKETPVSDVPIDIVTTTPDAEASGSSSTEITPLIPFESPKDTEIPQTESSPSILDQSESESAIPPDDGGVMNLSVPPGAVADSPNQFTFTSQSVLPRVDKTSGALTQSVQLDIPPGRLGVQPDLRLEYNNQNTEDNIFGYGWKLSIPYIERLNKTGSENLYTDNYFVSSLGGELASTTTSTSTPVEYRHKNEDGKFIKYTFSNNTWIAYDKNGVKYTFGTTTQAQQYATSTSSRVYKWMLEEIRDPNDNFVRFVYAKDNNQIYPLQVLYTGHNTTDGVMSVTFATSTRPDPFVSYKPGFKVQTNHKITEITMAVNGTWVRKYELGYGIGANGVRSILNSVELTGKDSNNTELSLPPITFEYATSTSLFMGPASTTIKSNSHVVADAKGNALNTVNVFYTNGISLAKTGLINGNSIGTVPETWADNNNTYAGYAWRPRGVRFFDVNGDGKAEIVVGYRDYTGTTTTKIYTNYYSSGGGYSWIESTTTVGTIPTFDYTTDNQTYTMNTGLLGNLNGDGLIDYVGALSGFVGGVYLGNGQGWNATSTIFNSVQYVPGVDGTPATNSQLVDINGDGLDDWVYSDDTTTYVKLNNGTGWDSTVDSRWTIATSTIYRVPGFTSYAAYWDRGMRFMDINGDGLVDFVRAYKTDSYTNTGAGVPDIEKADVKFVFLNTGTGWATSTVYANQLSSYITTGFIDTNSTWLGEVRYNEYGNWNGNGQQYQDVLSSINYPKGGSTDIEYNLTAQTTTNPELATSLLVVKKTTENDGNSHSKITDYGYIGGKLNLNDGVRDRKFAGFKMIVATSSSAIVKTFYNQGDSIDQSLGEQSDSFAQIGQMFREDVISTTTGVSLQKNFYKWSTFDQGYNNRKFTFLATTSEQQFDSSGSSHKDRTVEYQYSTTTGDVLSVIQKGETSVSDDGSYGDITGDGITKTITYGQNSTLNSSLPTSETVVSEQGTTTKETKFYYDNQSFGTVTLGNKTKEENWTASSHYASTTQTYNSYGLIATSTNPLYKSTGYVYDSYNMYPATSTNSLGHATGYVYDYATGKQRFVFDPNGLSHQYIFDPLGRLSEEKHPDPSTGTLSTKTTLTYTDTGFPTKIQKTDSLDGSTSVDTYTFFDGLNRTIQERKEAQGSNTYIVKDVIYDDTGRISRDSLPYFASSTTYSTATSTLALYTLYDYDALNRVTVATTSVGSTYYTYTPWQTTITDPNGNDKELLYDAYDRLIQVNENPGEEEMMMSVMGEGEGSEATTIGFTSDGKEIKRLIVKATSLSDSGDIELYSTTTGWTKSLADSSVSIKNTSEGEFIIFTNTILKNSISLSIGTTTTPVSGIETQKGTWAHKEIVYKDAISSGVDLRVRADGNRVVKDVVIKNKKSLPAEKELVNFDIPFKITSNTSIDLVSASSSLKTLGTFTTSDTVKVTNDSGVIGYIVAPRARDAKYHDRPDGQIFISVKYEMRKDGIYATKHIPMSWLMTASYPVEADLTLTAQDAIGDGYMHSDPYPGSWSSQHDSTSGRSANYTGTESRVHSSKYASGGSGQISITRSFLVFDTRSLPSNATINTASVHVIPTWVRDEYNDAYGYVAVYQGGQSATTSVVNLDYPLCGNAITNPTRGSDKLDLSGVSVSADTSLLLNSAGKSWITPLGYSKLCLREGHDAENVEVSDIFNGGWDTAGFDFYSADQTGTSQDPYLTIDYTVPNGTSTPPTETPYMYDSNHNLVQMTDALGNIRRFTYDGMNRRITAEDLHEVGDSNYGTYTYTYDDTGNMTSIVDPKSQTINYTYDDLSRPLTENYTGGSGTEITYTYDSCNLGKGQLCTASTTDALISNVYNYSGLLASTTKVINGSTYTASTTYDRLGNPLIVVNPNGSQIKYEYGNSGTLSKVLYKKSGGSTFDDVVDSFEYAPTGAVYRQVNQNGTESVYTYDQSKMYRLTNLTTTSGGGGGSQLLTAYTGAGDGSIRYWNTTSFSTARNASSGQNGGGSGVDTSNVVEGTTNWTDGSSHWVLSRTFLPFDTSALPTGATVNSATLYIKGKKYVNGGNVSLIKTTQASGSSLTDSDYGKVVFTKIADDKNANDWGTSPSVQSWALNSTGYSWINDATTTAMAIVSSYDFSNTDPGGGSGNNYGFADVSTSRDTSYKPYLEINYTAAGGAPLQNISYLYDANGNITKITDISATDAKKTVEFTYDTLNRLSIATTTFASTTPYREEYSYNELGNLLTKTGIGAYTYGTTTYANPHAPKTVNGVSYTYDNNGNLTNDGTYTYTWDYKNRLASTGNGTATTTYGYDPSGQRLWKKITSVATTTYAFPTYSILGTGTTTTYISAGVSLVSNVDQLGTSTPIVNTVHNDHLGSTNIVSNSVGAIVQTLDYYPYGDVRIDTQVNSSDSAKKYIGQFYDEENSMSYLNARYLKNTRGQFLSEDPMFWSDPTIQWLIDPQNQNSYSYARNNPVTLSDPTGRTIGDMIIGFGNALGSNIALGAGRINSNLYGGNQEDYSTGQSIGDFAGMVFGATAIVGGSTIAGSGALVTVGSAGATAAVSVPVVAGGAAITTYGVGVGSISAYNFSNSDKTPYKRPSGATTKAQREYVNQPGSVCSTCGKGGEKMYADHKVPLVIEHYNTGKINIQNMRSINAVQPQCASCSNRQGGLLSALSKALKSLSSLIK